MLLVQTKEVNKWIGARQLLKDISFNIYRGNKIGFVGHNGTRETANEIWELSSNGLDCFKGIYNDFFKYKQGDFKAGQELEDELVKMKRVELLTQLEQTSDEKKIEKINTELDQLC